MSEGTPSLAQKLLANRVKREIVTVDDGNGPTALEVRGLTLAQRHKINERCSVQTGPDTRSLDYEKFFPDLVRACVYDPATGARVFAESSDDALNEWDHESLQALVTKALDLSGMSAAEGRQLGNGASGTLTGTSAISSPGSSEEQSPS